MKTEGWPERLAETMASYPSTDHGDWIEIPSGMWLCTFRSAELRAAVSTLRDSNLRFRDAYLNAYGKNLLGKKWGTTKVSTAQELNRSLYSQSSYIDRKNQLVRDSFSGDHYQLWGHDGVTDYTLYTENDVRKVRPSPLPASRPNLETPANDRLVAEINASTGRSCWVDVDRVYARAGWVNVGRFGAKSFRSRQSDTFYITSDIRTSPPAFADVFTFVYAYGLLGRPNFLSPEFLLGMLTSWVAAGGTLRMVEFDVDFLKTAVTQGRADCLERLAALTPSVAFDSGSDRTSALLEFWLEQRGRRRVDPASVADQLRRRGFSATIGRGDAMLDPHGSLSEFCWSITATVS